MDISNFRVIYNVGFKKFSLYRKCYYFHEERRTLLLGPNPRKYYSDRELGVQAKPVIFCKEKHEDWLFLPHEHGRLGIFPEPVVYMNLAQCAII
jgi:hypothetical protein